MGNGMQQGTAYAVRNKLPRENSKSVCKWGGGCRGWLGGGGGSQEKALFSYLELWNIRVPECWGCWRYFPSCSTEISLSLYILSQKSCSPSILNPPDSCPKHLCTIFSTLKEQEFCHPLPHSWNHSPGNSPFPATFCPFPLHREEVVRTCGYQKGRYFTN